ncbi:hypothetical protein MBSD_n2255 [Mizugakiibacter sediminis]|uniref:Flavodoxin-like domain-containing protein n=1 Tax=Mizugakiibacter sediminis TaxID=1475481 RepID=A0A0K8QPV6_9GAMM|nr:flavodoxin [Mizugakiibacter sediminis]GAP66939.1 hypothetical protein MBSD_n2255 [Mizugakiibacter sediminis]
MRILVVYYSRTGITRSLAESLAVRLDADLSPIEEAASRRGVRGWLRSALEARREALPPLLTPRHDPSKYDLVVIGTPVWFGRVSSPVRSYLQANRGRIRRAAFFCTMGGRGAQHAFEDMSEALDMAPVTQAAFADREIAEQTHYRTLEHLAGFLRAAAFVAPSFLHAHGAAAGSVHP